LKRKNLFSILGVIGFLLLPILSACGDATSPGQIAASPTPVPVTTPPATKAVTVEPTLNPSTGVPTAVETSPATTTQVALKAAPMPEGRAILLSKSIDDLNLEVAVAPGIIGNNKFIARLSLSDGSAVDNASLVKIACTHKDMPEMGTAVLNLKLVGTDQPGLYQGEGYLMTMYGNWKMDVLVQRPGKADIQTTFDLSLTSSK
jgi:hypothetical protein